MQQPDHHSPVGKDKGAPEEEWLSKVEDEQPQCDAENSNSGNVTWKLLETVPLSYMGKAEPSGPEVHPQGCEPSPQCPPSLSKKHCENQATLLQFDRQAPGRISTSPTLRRLRGSGWGTSSSLPQQDALEEPIWESWRVLASSPGHLSRSPMESPKDLPHSLYPLKPHSGRPADPTGVLNTASSMELQTRSSDEGLLPKLRPPLKTSLCQHSLLELESHQMSHPSPQHLSPQGEESHSSSRGLNTETFWYRKGDQVIPATMGLVPSDLTSLGPRPSGLVLYEHRRSSVVLNLPGLEVFPGDLLVSDGAADYLCHPLLLLNSETKKTRWPFSKRGVQGKDKHKYITDLENCLSAVKITDFRDYEFCGLKDKTWNEVVAAHQKASSNRLELSRQQEAVWELVASECTYFLDHLLVLKMIFMNTLKYLQIHEYLLDVDLWRLFANLEELTQISLGFVNSLFSVIKGYINVDTSETSLRMDFISALTKCFRGSLCQSHQMYCLNYSAAVLYLETLKHRDDFSIYLKWCEQNEQCGRLHLPELLVAPLHRLTRYPLLLKNIWKRSTDSTEKMMIYSIKEKVEKSLRDLEGKVKWLDNFQKFRHLQEIIVWPPLWDRDKRFFIPEYLKHIFKEHMAENILSPTNRHLLYEGKLTLAESARFLDVYLFLFDDFLLVTKTKRNKKKLGGSDASLLCPSLTAELQAIIKEGGSCMVVDQPIPLDRLVVKSIDPLHESVVGLKNAFLLQHENRYRQCIAAFLLQAQKEDVKKAWIAQITAATSCFTKNQETKKISSFTVPAESSEI